MSHLEIATFPVATVFTRILLARARARGLHRCARALVALLGLQFAHLFAPATLRVADVRAVGLALPVAPGVHGALLHHWNMTAKKSSPSQNGVC